MKFIVASVGIVASLVALKELVVAIAFVFDYSKIALVSILFFVEIGIYLVIIEKRYMRKHEKAF
ncbi:MAG: hypothetical protein F6J93_31360 [Oscillatoria sp. SIO1A7]|nr:hypothetical protein [Oscillatoria sp. SIO1A7]